MILIIYPFLVAIVGALIYGFAANPKLQNMGLVLFSVGSFWTVALLSGTHFNLPR